MCKRIFGFPLFLGSFLPSVLQAPGLCACSALVPGTGTRLAALSPLKAGPAAIEVALLLPDELVRPPGGATLTFTTENEVTDETLTEANPFNSQSDETAGVVVPLNARARCIPLATEGVPRVTACQGTVSAWKQANRDSVHGSITIGIAACLFKPSLPPDALASGYIRLSPDTAFLPLLRDLNIKTLRKAIFPPMLR
jgi:hypothetical protein